MKKVACNTTVSVSLLFVASILTLALAIVPFMPTTALAWHGGAHQWAAEQALTLFRSGPGTAEPDPELISRDRFIDGKYLPIYPELGLITEWYDPNIGCCDEAHKQTWHNWYWVKECAMKKDDLDGGIASMNHFWYPEEGLHECPDDVAGRNNAWEEMLLHWREAISKWNAGDLGAAYAHLGYAIHLIQDVGHPAHSNEDMHPGDVLSDDDSIEDWQNSFHENAYCRAHFRWDTEHTIPAPYGYVILSQKSNDEISNDVLNATWPEAGDMHADWLNDVMPNGEAVYNLPQVFYMMYFLSQIGGYFASDDHDGNMSDPTGWLGGFPGFPRHWPEHPTLEIQDDDGLSDNDACDCDPTDSDPRAAGDLKTIMYWAYGSTFRLTPGIIDLFRRTVDSVPPVTNVQVSRTDGNQVKLPPEWNNSPVTVQLVGAVDYGNPSLRPSGVWKVWGKCNGNTPADPNAPSWALSSDGKYTCECMSTDWVGNVEQDQDVEIWIDRTPPVVTFPDLRPNYLTSETFTATWNATDAHSGVASEVAYLDNVLVTKGQIFDLAQLAGLHTLRVIVYDNAGNWTDVTYDFEVWIDADGWCFSVLINNKTKGNAMSCVVEFPAYYNIGIVYLTTSTLAVKGALDLEQSDPIIGETAMLQAQLLTGVGDHDKDGIPDRMLQFRKDHFVNALSGQTGDIQSIISGGLLPSGQPRFIAEVIVPVFKSTKK